jgi:hypothetical protein
MDFMELREPHQPGSFFYEMFLGTEEWQLHRNRTDRAETLLSTSDSPRPLHSMPTPRSGTNAVAIVRPRTDFR